MKNTMSAKDAKTWFGAVPPDLSVIARAVLLKLALVLTGCTPICVLTTKMIPVLQAGTTWCSRNVGMPHALWEMAVRDAICGRKDPHDASKTYINLSALKK
jgi:ubiquinol-cytochrome c reductase cytochrome c1 subunit